MEGVKEVDQWCAISSIEPRKLFQNIRQNVVLISMLVDWSLIKGCYHYFKSRVLMKRLPHFTISTHLHKLQKKLWRRGLDRHRLLAQTTLLRLCYVTSFSHYDIIIANAKFPPIIALLNRYTYHKKSRSCPQISWALKINE